MKRKKPTRSVGFCVANWRSVLGCRDRAGVTPQTLPRLRLAVAERRGQVFVYHRRRRTVFGYLVHNVRRTVLADR